MSRILGSLCAAVWSIGVVGIAAAEESDRAIPLPPPPPQAASARTLTEVPRPRCLLTNPRIEKPAARTATDPNRAARIHEAIALLKADGLAGNARGIVIDHNPLQADPPAPPESLRKAATGEVPFGK